MHIGISLYLLFEGFYLLLLFGISLFKLLKLLEFLVSDAFLPLVLLSHLFILFSLLVLFLFSLILLFLLGLLGFGC